MKRKVVVLKGLIFVIVFFVLFLIFNRLLILKAYPVGENLNNQFSPYCLANEMEGYYELDENTIDVFFCGNSHVHCGVNPIEIWKKYGYTSYDLSAAQQDLQTTYYYLKEGLKTQTPKAVVVDVNSFSDKQQLLGAHCSSDFMHMSYNKIDMIISRVEEKLWPGMFVPLYDYHARWKELKKDDFLYFTAPKDNKFYGYFAFTYTVPENTEPQMLEENTSCREFSAYEQEYLDKICDLCRSNGISLMYVTVPTMIGNDYRELSNALSQYCEEKGIPYIDYHLMGTQIGFDYDRDFADLVHMNIYGSKKFSSVIGKDVAEYANITGAIGEQNRAEWDANVDFYDRLVDNYEFGQIKEYEDFIEAIYSLDDCVSFIVGSGDVSSSLNYSDYISDEENHWSYYAIIDEGEIYFEDKQNQTQYYVFDMYGHNFILESDVDYGTSSLRYDYENAMENSRGINVMVYDKVLDKIVCTRNFDIYTLQ